MSRTRWQELAGPVMFLAAVTAICAHLSPGLQIQARLGLCNLVIVVALYTFVGNSGVLSFGHVSFVALGAYSAGLVSVNPVQKRATMGALFPWLRSVHGGTPVSMVVAVVVGAVFAGLVAVPLMRLSGLQAGIATFALLMVTNNVLSNWNRIGPAKLSMVRVPKTITFPIGFLCSAIVVVVAWWYQQARSGRLLRASREDLLAAGASGINVTAHRIVAFMLSGAMAALGGAMWAHVNGVVKAENLGIELTFLTLAMLVVGGMQSLWGAVLGTAVVTFVSELLSRLQIGIHLDGAVLRIPQGTRPVVLGAIMALALVLRPQGLTGGREFLLLSWSQRMLRTPKWPR